MKCVRVEEEKAQEMREQEGNREGNFVHSSIETDLPVSQKQ